MDLVIMQINKDFMLPQVNLKSFAALCFLESLKNLYVACAVQNTPNNTFNI